MFYVDRSSIRRRFRGKVAVFFFFLMPEDDLELRSKVNLFPFGNIAGFIGESSPQQTSLGENRMKKN